MDFPIASFGAALIGTLAILAWRVRESRRPVSLRSLIIPPLGMSTGFSMFAMPAFRIPWTWGLAAFVLGALVFAYPLVSSPQLTVEDGLIMMRRSRWFLVVILGLAAVRLGLRECTSAALFPSSRPRDSSSVLAFGMIVRWRTTLLLEYPAPHRPLTNH